MECQGLILQTKRNRLPITYLEKLKSKKLEKKLCIACVYAQAKFVIEFICIPYSPTGPKRQQIATMSIVGYACFITLEKCDFLFLDCIKVLLTHLFIPISLDNRLCHFYLYNVVELECLVYNSTREKVLFFYLKRSQIAIFGNFKSFFQTDHQVDLGMYLIEVTILHFHRELAFLTPSL